MDSAGDIIMNDPGLFERPDPVVERRLQSFDEDGELRCSLAKWLDDVEGRLGRARKYWRTRTVEAARKHVKERAKKIYGPLTEDDTFILDTIWPMGIRECLVSCGMESNMLEQLLGNKDDYDVKICSYESLAHLLCYGSDVDLVIGSGIPSKH